VRNFVFDLASYHESKNKQPLVLQSDVSIISRDDAKLQALCFRQFKKKCINAWPSNISTIMDFTHRRLSSGKFSVHICPCCSKIIFENVVTHFLAANQLFNSLRMRHAPASRGSRLLLC
jgi:hypothetical protein